MNPQARTCFGDCNGCGRRCQDQAADDLLARAERAERERDEAHAAIARDDERHAEAIAAVRKRAEKAEAEVARLRVIEAAARELERANDAALGAFRPRPDIAWRNLKVALRPTAAKPTEGT